MGGLSLAMVIWQAMHFAAAGIPIDSPGSGLVWQSWHFSPNARCCLWLYGIGCSGGVDLLSAADSEVLKTRKAQSAMPLALAESGQYLWGGFPEPRRTPTSGLLLKAPSSAVAQRDIPRSAWKETGWSASDSASRPKQTRCHP